MKYSIKNIDKDYYGYISTNGKCVIIFKRLRDNDVAHVEVCNKLIDGLESLQGKWYISQLINPLDLSEEDRCSLRRYLFVQRAEDEEPNNGGEVIIKYKKYNFDIICEGKNVATIEVSNYKKTLLKVWRVFYIALLILLLTNSLIFAICRLINNTAKSETSEPEYTESEVVQNDAPMYHQPSDSKQEESVSHVEEVSVATAIEGTNKEEKPEEVPPTDTRKSRYKDLVESANKSYNEYYKTGNPRTAEKAIKKYKEALNIKYEYKIAQKRNDLEFDVLVKEADEDYINYFATGDVKAANNAIQKYQKARNVKRDDNVLNKINKLEKEIGL